jgi:hypothetical protein
MRERERGGWLLIWLRMMRRMGRRRGLMRFRGRMDEFGEGRETARSILNYTGLCCCETSDFTLVREGEDGTGD